MKKRALMAFTMLSFIGTGAVSSVNAQSAPHFIRVTTIISEDRIVGSAYNDALTILKARNSCSDFFGGSSVALEFSKASSDGYEEITTRYQLACACRVLLPASLMTGPKHRIACSRKSRSIGTVPVPSIEVQLPNPSPISRALEDVVQLKGDSGSDAPARARPSVKGSGRKLVLPDDGNDAAWSSANSQKVDEVCGDQIRELSKNCSVKKHSKPAQPRETLARVSTSAEPRD